jgi:alkanesulfonate monooxygenase SsuD/methylene tetrahydromethanopterin reductase-like flavin-dependent oxidoreductase (luciferase family)
MKCMWFHLMPYTELPDDFREKHPSVWVDIHSSLFDPQRAHLMYNDFLDELEFAADCGFDAICCNEHHSNGYGLMPSPNLIASALARRTTDTAICVMGNSLALYNPPTRVAEEFAMIDCISGGRLIAGFPVGTPMDTTYAYGANPSSLRDRYYEAHDLVMKAWTEKETFSFNGRFNQQRYVNIWPRPVQQPHPPIWIPGAGSVETWRWAAQSAEAKGPSTNASSAQKMQSLARDMKGIVDNGYVIIGSPKDVTEQLHELAKTLNVGNLMLLMQFGSLSKELTKYNTKLFAEQVMPNLKPLFSEWEHKWWPKPMQPSARAAIPAFAPRVQAAE